MRREGRMPEAAMDRTSGMRREGRRPVAVRPACRGQAQAGIQEGETGMRDNCAFSRADGLTAGVG